MSQIKFVAACGTGMNAANAIKDAVEKEMKERGFDVTVETHKSADVTAEILSDAKAYLTIAKHDLSFEPTVPVVDAGALLYGINTMATPVFDEIQKIIEA